MQQESSIEKNLSYRDAINTVLLQKNHPLSSKLVFIIIVEGKDDIKFYQNIFKRADEICFQQSYSGCCFVDRIVNELLEHHGIERVIGIVDADFFHLTEKERNNSRLFHTDYHDIELYTILSDRCFDKVIAEYFEDSKKPPNGLRDTLFLIARYIGSARLFNELNGIELCFKNLPYHEFILTDSWSFNLARFIEILTKKSKIDKGSITSTDIENVYNNLQYENSQIVNGHDFMGIFACYLYNNDIKKCKPDELSRNLRLAYSLADFKKTKLYADLKELEVSFGICFFVCD